MPDERMLQTDDKGPEISMDELKKQLVAAIPQMMIYARSRVGHIDEANELVQEALERILKRLPQLVGDDDINFVAYGKRVVRNVHIEKWRASRRTIHGFPWCGRQWISSQRWFTEEIRSAASRARTPA